MGKKIPMWQCILVMIVLIALIFWGVMIDTDAGEAHVSLILSLIHISVIMPYRYCFFRNAFL